VCTSMDVVSRGAGAVAGGAESVGGGEDSVGFVVDADILWGVCVGGGGWRGYGRVAGW